MQARTASIRTESLAAKVGADKMHLKWNRELYARDELLTDYTWLLGVNVIDKRHFEGYCSQAACERDRSICQRIESAFMSEIIVCKVAQARYISVSTNHCLPLLAWSQHGSNILFAAANHQPSARTCFSDSDLVKLHLSSATDIKADVSVDDFRFDAISREKEGLQTRLMAHIEQYASAVRTDILAGVATIFVQFRYYSSLKRNDTEASSPTIINNNGSWTMINSWGRALIVEAVMRLCMTSPCSDQSWNRSSVGDRHSWPILMQAMRIASNATSPRSSTSAGFSDSAASTTNQKNMFRSCEISCQELCWDAISFGTTS